MTSASLLGLIYVLSELGLAFNLVYLLPGAAIPEAPALGLSGILHIQVL